MLQKINNKYYIKQDSKFYEVEFVCSDNDVSIKPTNKTIKVNDDLQIEDVNYQDLKKSLLKENKKPHVEEEKSEDKETKYPKKFTKYNK